MTVDAGSYYVDPNITLAAEYPSIAPIVLGIHKLAGATPNACDDKLHVPECIADFLTIIEDCNHYPMNVSSGGSYIEPICGWEYEVDLSPPMSEKAFEDAMSAGAVTERSLTKRAPDCNKDGFRWPIQAINVGVSDICKLMDRKLLLPLQNFDMDFYYFFDLSKKPIKPQKAVSDPRCPLAAWKMLTACA